jgi:hypothetical protein
MPAPPNEITYGLRSRLISHCDVCCTDIDLRRANIGMTRHITKPIRKLSAK